VYQKLKSIEDFQHNMRAVLYHGITSEEEIQESTFCRKSDAHTFLGLTRGNTGTLPVKGFNSKQCKV
jgi:hypothetical protein